MNLYNKILLISLSSFFAITLFAKDFTIELTFDNFFLESQKIFVQDLNQISSRNDLENLIKAQDWIDEYKINFKPFTKSAKLSISSRKPYFILNNNYFIDKNLKKFRFDETQLDLILVEGPIIDLKEPMNIINFFEIKRFNQLSIKRIIYTYVAGWEIHTNSFKIKIGKNITDQKLKSLEDTLNYLYENRKIPSMIDLRNKDGVALNYGK
ncbi:cell division protein FtsQ [Gammaproteobacteria bacterium]|nr:cell division protein FtsQ [Gammaproteobacteria bacterium]